MNYTELYKEIACPVCDSIERTVLYPDTLGSELPKFNYDFSPSHNFTYQIVKCEKCSHAYSSPIPLKIWENYSAVKDYAYLKNEAMRYATAEKAIKKIKRYKDGGCLLDVGCATGDFMSVAQNSFSVEGLEISSWAADLGRERGLTIHSCLLEDIKGNSLYDVVTLWGVIEHFERPRIEVEHIFRLLKPGGIVCLWTGDVNCLLSRLLKKRWWWIQGQHIQYFSRKSLRQLFESSGFNEKWIGKYPYVMTTEGICQSLGRYQLIRKTLVPLMKLILPPNFKITITLPGEMFAIFKKNI